MNNVLLYIGALFAIALAVLFGAPHFIDWNAYRGTFEEEASRLLGREVRVGGEVSLSLLPTPAVRFEKVRIVDSSGRVGEPFFRADDFAIHLNVGPLLKGIVEANEIELRRPVLRLTFDDKGRGNWVGLGPRADVAGIVPQEITLQSVRITDGMVVIHGSNGEERLSLRNVNGELSSEAIEGPYKFKGAYRLGDSLQEVRIATARADGDGTIRLKVGVEIANSATGLEFAGQLIDLTAKPRLEGELTTRVRPNASASTEPKAASETAAYEIKGKARADADGFSVTDINFPFDANGRPQLVTGSLVGSWGRSVSLKATLASHWLDADRLIGAKSGAGPGPVLTGLASRALDLLPAAADASIDAVFDQVSLAGDMVGGVRIGVDRIADRVEIRELRASLPGAARLDLRGKINGLGSDRARYDGDVTLRGQSLARLLAWAFRENPPLAIAKDGPFGWISNVAATAADITASQVRAEVAGQPLQGNVALTLGKRPRVKVEAEALELDLAGFPAIPAGWLAIARGVLHPSATPVRGELPDLDLTVRATVGRVAIGERWLRDVDAQISIEGDRLAVSALRLRLDDGLALDATGELAGLAGDPHGTLAGVFTALSPAALDVAVDIFGIPDAWRPSDKRAAAMTPLRLAYRAQLPASRKDALVVTLDGSARDTRVAIDSKLVAAETGWADAKADVNLELSGNDARGLLALVAPQAAEFADRVGALPARLTARGLGQIGSGAFALVTLDTDGMIGAYSGQMLGLTPTTLPRLDGELSFKGELQRALILAGLGARPGVGTQQIDGNVRITSTDAAIEFKARELRFDGALVSGSATLSSVEGKRHVDARVVAESASVPRMLALLLDGRAQPARPGAEALAPEQLSRWPEESFDFSSLEGLSATVSLSAGALTVADGLTLRDARLEASMGDGAIDITRVSGTALEGRLTGSLRLQKVPGGAALTSQLTLANASLEGLSAAGTQPGASGSASGTLQFGARATNPRGLVASMQGKGTLEVGPARLHRFAPKALRAAAESHLQAKADAAGPDAIRAGIAASLTKGEIGIDRRQLALTMQDGRIAVEELGLTTPEGRLAARFTLDLSALRADSDWRIEAVAPAGSGRTEGRGAMPPVTVIFSGPLSTLGTHEPQVKTDAFERELVVRRMERDVEELERVRRLDEERARAEADRQRRLEAARDAAPPPTIIAPMPIPAPPPMTPAPTLPSPGAAPPAISPGSDGATPSPPGPSGPAVVLPPDAGRRPEGLPRAPQVRAPSPVPRPFTFPSDLGGGG